MQNYVKLRYAQQKRYTESLFAKLFSRKHWLMSVRHLKWHLGQSCVCCEGKQDYNQHNIGAAAGRAVFCWSDAALARWICWRGCWPDIPPGAAARRTCTSNNLFSSPAALLTSRLPRHQTPVRNLPLVLRTRDLRPILNIVFWQKDGKCLKNTFLIIIVSHFVAESRANIQQFRRGLCTKMLISLGWNWDISAPRARRRQ